MATIFMKRRPFRIVLLLYCLISLAVSAQSVDSIHLRIYDGEAKCNHFVFDFDGNGTEELIMLSRPREQQGDYRVMPRIVVVDPATIQTIEQINVSVFGDLYVRRDPETSDVVFGIIHKSGFSGYISEFDKEGKRLRQIRIDTATDTNEDDVWQGDVGFTGLYDATGDGVEDILCYMNSGYDLTPRSFYLVDGSDLSLIRERETPFLLGPNYCKLVRPVEDEEPILLVSTYACANGVERGGFTDTVSHLTAFSADLTEVISHRQFGGKFTNLTIAGLYDYDGDGVREVYALTRNNNSQLYIERSIAVVDPLSGIIELERKGPTTNLTNGMLVDFDNDGVPTLMHATSDGFLEKLSPRLEVLKSIDISNLGTTNVAVINAIDLDGDYYNDLLLHHNSALNDDETTYHLLNDQLELIAQGTFSPRAGLTKIVEFRDSIKKETNPLLLTDRYAARLSIVPEMAVPAVGGSLMGWIAAAMVAVLAVAVILAITIANKRKLHEVQNRDQSDVLHMIQEVLHNVKTHLSVFSTDIDYLRNEVKKNNISDDYIDVLEDMRTTYQTIHHRTRSILHLTRISEPVKNTTNINHLVQEVIRDNQHALSDDCDLHIRLEEDLPTLQADSDQLRSVITNLLENAHKAVKGAGTILITTDRFRHLELNGSKKDREWIRVSVIDSGSGLPKGDPERLFESGYSEFDTGLGIGLAVCKRIVTNHGGSISAEAVASKGAAFHVDLPAE